MSLKKLGRYELLRVLGKGAMGLVYEGLDPNLNRRVAIKTIKVENLSEEAAAEYEVRFRVEAQSAARLQHPNIVSVYDSARDGDIAYMVMEFIQGEDLKHHLDNGTLYTLEQTLGIMQDLLAALDYAHAQNIVHRDIKPANLLIEKSGRVKLTDFGVARIQDSGEATRTQGTMVGTLKYMSPEQVQGRPVDARADIFAAGIVLYQLLTGKRPFDGSTDFAIIQQIVGHTPAAPTFFNSKLPPAIDGVVSRALAKVREQRYGTAKDFLAELQAASRDAIDPTVVPPAGPRVPGVSGTWTSTARPEALMGLQPGLQSNGGVGQSTVTQEIELVYWKDIKDSHDVEDLQGFMNKFPSGIYADLARRRLRQLGVIVGDESEIGGSLGTGTVVLPRSAQAYEPTMQLEKGQLLPGGLAALASAPGFAATEIPDDVAPTVFQPTQQMDRAMPRAAAASVTDTAWLPVRALSDDETLPPAARSRPQPPASPVAPPTPVVPAVTAPRVAIQDAPPAQRRPLLWAAAAVLLLVGAGLGISRLNSAAVSGGTNAAAASSVAPAPAQAAAAVLTAPSPSAVSAAVAAPAVASTPPVATVAPQVFSLGLEPANPQTAAELKAAADAKATRKADREKEKLARQAQTAAAITAVPAPAAPAEEPVSTKRPAAAPAPAPAVATGGTSPRQACEDRMLLGFQICMAEQCAKRTFTNHPICVDRRAMEERRRESEQSRR